MDFKKDFPIFGKRDLVYLDSAATAQKPQAVLDAITEYYTHFNSNIHRGPNFLSEEATVAYEDARRVTADFIHAENKHEIIFTRNTTESINLVARSLESQFQKGDEILLSKLEHHSNIVPWLQLSEKTGVNIKYIPIDSEGRLEFAEELINEKTRLVAITAMNNSLAVMPELEPIIKVAHSKNALVLVDVAQSIVHQEVDVQKLGVDFIVFSGHKIYGPTGIGVLWGRTELLEQMEPFLGGGSMINEVFEDHFTPAGLPEKFEAGTPNIAGAIGLKAALQYVLDIGYSKIHKYEKELTEYLLGKLTSMPYVEIIGPKDLKNRGSLVSFGIEGVHPHDIAEGLSQQNIVIRAGHHCNQVLMDHYGLPGTARISLALYNTEEDIDKAVKTLEETHKYFN